MAEIENKSNKQEGHRSRLRKRFMQSGIDGFLDYEIVELLLTLGTPRRDCKGMAKDTIKRFGGLKNTLDASVEDLQQIRGIGPSNSFGIKLFQAISERLAKEKISEKNLLNSSKNVANYLQKSIGREKKEYFVVLALDIHHNLIKEFNISTGSLNASVVHPREVFKEVIQVSAAQIIIGHNHPSANPDPSPEDIALARRLEEVSKIMGIELLDHIIVTKDKYISLKEQGLM